MPETANNEGKESRRLAGGLLKSLKMTGVGMPGYYAREIATGELAQGDG